MKSKGQNTGAQGEKRKADSSAALRNDKQDVGGLGAAARVIAAGGRVPKKFTKARPASAGPTLGAAAALVKITAARRVAFEILTLVGEGKGHSDELLHGVRMEELSEADRHLATALVMGVLRWQIALDASVRRLLERPEQRLAEPVSIALRLGAFQLLHMDRIPAHAALSESVEMCRAAGEPHAAGMVNAVLRKVAGLRTDTLVRTPIFETTASFAERLGHPTWLVERWVAAYGREAAMKICEADQAEPGRGGLFGSREDPSEGRGETEPNLGHPPGLARLPEIDDGSRLVAELAAAALPNMEGRAARVWDCCAAPGGKTLVLAAMLGGAEVLATDVSAKRMKGMEGRLRRFAYAGGVKTGVAEVAALPENAGEFDLILCDVPCSGTGTLGRNPEIRLRLAVEEFARQAARQREILAAALGRLAPGGRLVYSTCSLEREENEAVVESVGEAFRRVPMDEVLLRLAPLLKVEKNMVREGALRTLPGVHPCDGFYAVVLERQPRGGA